MSVVATPVYNRGYCNRIIVIKEKLKAFVVFVVVCVKRGEGWGVSLTWANPTKCNC